MEWFQTEIQEQYINYIYCAQCLLEDPSGNLYELDFTAAAGGVTPELRQMAIDSIAKLVAEKKEKYHAEIR